MVIENKLVKSLATTTLIVLASLCSATSMASQDITVGFGYLRTCGAAGWPYQLHRRGQARPP